MFLDETIKFREVDAVPFAESAHKEVNCLVETVKGLDTLSYDEVSFLCGSLDA